MNRICRSVVVLLGLMFAGPLHAELRLWAKYEGREVQVLGMENGRVVAMEGERKILLPRKTEYRLEGNLAAEAEKVNWSPNYGVHRERLFEKTARSDAVAMARVTVRHLAELDGKSVPSDFIARWPAGTEEGGLVVMLWLVDTRIAQVAVRKFPPTKSAKFFGIVEEFPLTEAETNGRAVMLLFSKGRFLTPAKRFKDAAAQAAFGDLLRGDVDSVRAALDRGLKVTARGLDDTTLLHFAAEAGLVDGVDLLLKRGAKINANGARGNPPLYWAALNGRLAVVTRLLDAKANANDALNSGDTPLLGAVRSGHQAVARLLIERGADVNAVNGSLESPYSVAIDEGFAELASLMRARGGKLGGPPGSLSGVLVTQARLGNVDMVRFLLSQQVPLPDPRAMVAPALTEAAVSERPELVPLLRGAGAAVNEVDGLGRPPLFVACAVGADAFAEALLEAGADVRIRARDGRTALHFAALANRPALVKRLIAQGAEVAVRDHDNRTPLDYALRVHAREAARELAAHGAVVDLGSVDGPELLGQAVAIDAAPVLRDALKNGWSPNAKLGYWSALWVASVCNSSECLAILQAAGAAPLPADAPPLVGVRELDSLPAVISSKLAVDPRDPDMPFPAAIVEIELVVDQDGLVRFPVVREAPNWRLATAALQAIKEWRFAQPTRQGKPASFRASIPLEFVSSAESIFGWMAADVLPVPLKRTPPVYPPDLQKSGQEGRVRLAFTVGKDGRVKQPRALSASNPGLVAPAIAAVLQWVFKPGEIDGSPEDVRLSQEIEFHLQ